MERCPYCAGDESKCDFSFETDRCSQMNDGRDIAAAADRLMKADDEELATILRHDPDMIRDVAAALAKDRYQLVTTQRSLAHSVAQRAKEAGQLVKCQLALEPFARFADRFGDHARDDSWQLTRNPSGKGNITMGDVRQARAALRDAPASGSNPVSKDGSMEGRGVEPTLRGATSPTLSDLSDDLVKP